MFPENKNRPGTVSKLKHNQPREFMKIIAMKKISLIILCFCLIILFPLLASANDVTLVPSLRISGEYDDNVFFNSTDEVDDYLTIISPGLTFDYATELLNLQSLIVVDFLRYFDETELDTENQRYDLNGRYQLASKWNIAGNFSYIKDTTLESELEETGIVHLREDRKRYNAGGGLSYQMTELTDLNFNYTHTATRYDSEDNVDYDYDNFSLLCNRKLKNQLDVLTVRTNYSIFDSDEEKTNNYELLFGWFHKFSETLDLNASAGPRYTRQNFNDDREDEDSWGTTVDISLNKRGETSSATIGYSRRIWNNADGDLVETDRIYARAKQRIIGRLGVGFVAGLYFTSQEDDSDNDDTRYYILNPSLYYMLTENHSIELAYSYQNELEESRPKDLESERNRIWIAFHFNFPRNW